LTTSFTNHGPPFNDQTFIFEGGTTFRFDMDETLGETTEEDTVSPKPT
jgi:hypothetical protein